MLQYAVHRPAMASRQFSPNALLVIVSVHVAVLAAVMSAKMDLPQRIRDKPLVVDLIKTPVPPPPVSPPHVAPAHPLPTPLPAPQSERQVPLPPVDRAPVLDGGSLDPGPLVGGGATVIPEIRNPVVTPVHRDARLLTPLAELKPPYPASKLLTQEEATLTLRLSIDERGRVVAVVPIGGADRDFLDAARRHLLAHWRYQPALEDGRAIPSTITVSLRFQLDG